MLVSRQGRELLLYIILTCCGLFVALVYFFHDSNMQFRFLSAGVSQTSDVSDASRNKSREVFYAYNSSFLDGYVNQSDITSDDLDSHIKVYDKLSKDDSKLSKDDIISSKDDSNISTDDDNLSTDDEHLSKDLSILASILESKLSAVTIEYPETFKPTCENKFKIANSCDNHTCLRTELPDQPRARVAQLILPRELRLSLEEHQVLREMADQITGFHDIILLTAASSNHFLESQALMKNLHETVFPRLGNFTLVFYNLGLTEQERSLMTKYCRCQVVDFPFHRFPRFMKRLTCYSWKPVMIKAQLKRANIVVWMDASVRFHGDIHSFIQKARERGVQIGGSGSDSTYRTYRSTYHFFGDEPCAYLKLGQAKATVGVYHREQFVDRVILEPWVACAVQEDCMCPANRPNAGCRDSKLAAKELSLGKGPIIYGLCHRYDQSALSLVLHKLYQELYKWVLVDIQRILTIRRRNTAVYFPQE